PVWAPDGTRIAFTSNRDYVFAVYIMNADGSNAHLLTDKVQDPASLAWSPDSSKIALSGGIRGVPAGAGAQPSVHIYTVNIDGSQLTKLTSDGINDSPTWSPDGRQIAFNSNRDADGRSKIWVMSPDGSNQKKLTDIHGTSNPLFYGDSSPVWSPDGSKILFNGYRDFNGTRNCFVVNCAELFVMNADGSNDVPLSNDPNRDGGFAARWSPDGTRIVASRSLGTVADHVNGVNMPTAIVVMNVDGSNSVNPSNRSERFYIDAPVDWQPLSTPAVSSSSVLGFSAASYSAYEDSGSITVTVKRTGNLNDMASCSYATQDGTAMVRTDYGPVFGRLQFGPGIAAKDIPIPLTDSASVRGSRTFKLTLSDNEGNATFLGGVRETTVTVLDRDISPRPKSPIDDTAYFVRQHYVDFLNREPDPEGLSFWISEIESCGSDIRCRELKQINVSAAFYLSIEFQETGFFAYRFNLLNPYNVNDTGFLTIVREMQEIGQGVIVGQTGWQAQLNANKLAFVQQYYDDDRLALSFGRTDAEYVDLLLQYVNLYSGVTLSPAKRDALVAGLATGNETRPQVFIDVTDDKQFKAALFNQVFVLMEYYGYLRRDPDQLGYNFWLEKLNKFHGNYIDAEMVKAFLTSIEYRARFG
ncbi:MAG TPA: Calx-beta domain-containing protein, partial [Pyrinomonadaceae bacterium]|nr:Calx-beta domain-containing protein [Pyrinomonadaceae bacterium]